jgi:phospholipid/cholesterol/gamma-HCH transport system permease protein
MDGLLDFLKPPVAGVQDFYILSGRALRNLFRGPHYADDIFIQMDAIGVGSLWIVILTGFFSGVVITMQMSRALEQYGATGQVGSIVAITLVRELGPVLTALLVAGRNASGIASELGSMKVTEQIDAMEVSAVNPYRLLAATRIVACILMLPLLTLASDACGLLTGWLAQTLVEPISLRQFIDAGFRGATLSDFLPPTFKTAVFGLIIGLIACYQGMRTRGGAEGVGRAATNSVVLASLFVILADVVLVKLILVIFH